MQSKAKDVTTYIQEAPAERQPYLEKLRALCREVLEGYDEVMEYGMAGYTRSGSDGVGFASQKQYISLYFVDVEVIEANRELLKGLSVGKCCVRYGSMKKMDFDVIRKLLEDTVRAEGEAG